MSSPTGTCAACSRCVCHRSELLCVHRRRTCSFASRAQTVPLALPPVAPATPSPLLPALHLLHPCMGPQCWLPSLPVSLTNPPPQSNSHPGRGPSSALHSSERSRLALRGTLGFTNCVRPRDGSVINTNRHMRGNNKATATKRSV